MDRDAGRPDAAVQSRVARVRRSEGALERRGRHAGEGVVGGGASRRSRVRPPGPGRGNAEPPARSSSSCACGAPTEWTAGFDSSSRRSTAATARKRLGSASAATSTTTSAKASSLLFWRKPAKCWPNRSTCRPRSTGCSRSSFRSSAIGRPSISSTTTTRLKTVAAIHADPEKMRLVKRMVGRYTHNRRYEPAIAAALRMRRPMVIRDVNVELLKKAAAPNLFPVIRELGPRSAITVPLRARGRTIGSLVAYWCETPRRYADTDLPLFEELTKRAAVSIDHARLYEREREIAAKFQRAALPISLPEVPGLHFDGIYVPASDRELLGGDWYDALRLNDGRIVISVGDVAGSGLPAAVIMSSMRQVIRGRRAGLRRPDRHARRGGSYAQDGASRHVRYGVRRRARSHRANAHACLGRTSSAVSARCGGGSDAAGHQRVAAGSARARRDRDDDAAAEFGSRRLLQRRSDRIGSQPRARLRAADGGDFRVRKSRAARIPPTQSIAPCSSAGATTMWWF